MTVLVYMTCQHQPIRAPSDTIAWLVLILVALIRFSVQTATTARQDQVYLTHVPLVLMTTNQASDSMLNLNVKIVQSTTSAP